MMSLTVASLVAFVIIIDDVERRRSLGGRTSSTGPPSIAES